MTPLGRIHDAPITVHYTYDSEWLLAHHFEVAYVCNALWEVFTDWRVSQTILPRVVQGDRSSQILNRKESLHNIIMSLKWNEPAVTDIIPTSSHCHRNVMHYSGLSGPLMRHWWMSDISAILEIGRDAMPLPIPQHMMYYDPRVVGQGLQLCIITCRTGEGWIM